MVTTEANFKLLRAAYSGEESDVKAALGSGHVDKNCHENTGYHYTAVQRAALSNESVVKFFIADTEVRLNLKDDLGRTLLHLSWRTCVERLEESKRMKPKDWDLCDKIDQTPFLTHARFVNGDIMEDLLRIELSSGEPAVDMTKTTIDGFTALHQVVEQDPLSFPTWYDFRPPGDRCNLVTLLLDTLKERARQTRLRARQPIPTVEDVPIPTVVEDVPIPTVEDVPPTVEDLEDDVLEFVNKKDKLNRSALHYIAEDGCVEILDTLRQWFTESKRSQISLEGLDLHGFAPLHLAVRRGHSHMVRKILEIRPLINLNLVATVTATDPPKLPKYEENHKQLCRPNLFSIKPSAEISGKQLSPLHFAAMRGHTEITGLLLGNETTDVCKNTEPSPFKYSIVNRHFQVAAQFLLDVHGRTTGSMGYDEKWNIFDTVLCLAEGSDDNTTANALLTKLQALTMPLVGCITVFDLTRIEQLITVAAKENRHKIIRHILKWRPEVNANFKSHWTIANHDLEVTPLHFAVSKEHVDAVRALLTHLLLDASTEGTEDSRFRTPLEIATQIKDSNTKREIERLLMGRPEVKEFVDRLYRDRQVFVDAANALLVGAALIASVTFAGWLQPPLGYTTYYDFPEPPPAPPNTYESFAAVKQHATVQAFWFFNSLSFFFAIATVLTGANAAMPSLENAFIGTVVKSVKKTLIHASFLLAFSVVCVLCAFATAGFAVLPPRAKYKWSMISTVAIGVFVCLICLRFFLWKLSEPIHSRLSLKELASKLLAPICWPLFTYLTGYS
ncbi:unnamed protein product [Sphagnum troendelagicum]